MKIITSYTGPDIDGIACIIGYSKILKSKKVSVKGVFDGDLGLEDEFVKNYTNYFPLEKVQSYKGYKDIVLLDTSDTNDINPTINPSAVSEIIDHRKVHHSYKFPNAVVDIQLVGSCATLIWERYQALSLSPSVEESIYLFSAIISNTINLKNKVTTERDVLAVNSLKLTGKIEDNYIEKMFKYKSQVDRNNLREVLLQDVAIKDYRGKKISIFQLEILGIEDLVRKNLQIILGVMEELKKEHDLDYIMFNGVDIFDGYNILLAPDKDSSNFFAQAFETDENLTSPYKIPEIVMRKEIWSRLESL